MPSVAELTWPEVAAGRRGAILAVPLGSTEQHGPHLPLSTDTDVARELCARLAAARGDVLVAPAMPFGASGEHAGFAGTLSIGTEALTTVLIELGRSADDTADHVLFVSAHGGNADAVTLAVQRLRSESRDVQAFGPTWEGEPHAGATETSMLLTLAPHLVRMELAEPGDTRPIAELLPELREHGVRAVSANGVLGDPRAATAAAGEQLLDRLTADLVAFVETWRNV